MWLFLLLLLLGGLGEVSLASAASPPALDWQFWEDPQAGHDIMVAWQSTEFRPLTPQNLILGFTSSAFWLRSQLHNPSDAPQTYWLEMENPRLESVQLSTRYVDDTGPGLIQMAGWRYPMAQRKVVADRVVFALTLPAHNTVALLLRVESRSAVSLSNALWWPLDFREAESLQHQLQGIMLGVVGVVAFYALFHGIIRRDKVFLFFAAWLLSSDLYAMIFIGTGYRYLWPEGGAEIVRITATLGGAITVLTTMMCISFLQLDTKLPRWAYQSVKSSFWLLGGEIIWLTFGHYEQAAYFLSLVLLFNNLTLLLALGFPGILDTFYTKLFGVCMVIFFAIWIHGQLVLLRIFPPYISQSNAWFLGYNITLVIVLLAGLIGRTVQVKREERLAQQDLEAVFHRQQEQLERAVVDRTQALHTALVAAEAANMAKTDFLARVSHDLRTPLTAIMGYADMIQAAGHANAPHGGVIRRSANHLLALIDDLIDYAKGTSQGDVLHPAPTYLHALIDTLAAEANTLAQKQGNQFVLNAHNLPSVVWVDAKRLRQILQNLLGNAAKFTHNGTIRLTVRSHLPDTLHAHLMFSVSDTGPGIAPADQARIFQPFERTASAGRTTQGLGLGLAIAAQWATRMNATLEVHSRPEHDTIFELGLTVPLADEADLPTHLLVDNYNVQSHLDGQGRVLLVARTTPTSATC